MQTEVQKAYLAAFVDGEGFVSIHARPNKCTIRSHLLMIGISNTHKETIDKLKAIWGGYLRIIQPDGIKNLRVLYRLLWQNNQAAELLRLIHPYMLVKAEQGRIGLAFVARIGGISGRDVITPDEWNLREDLRLEIAKHRTKGHKTLYERLPFPRPMNACEGCGKPFISRRNKRYCGTVCWHATRYRRVEAVTEPIEYHCQHCGKVFSVKRRGRMFCSKACGMAAAHRRKKNQA